MFASPTLYSKNVNYIDLSDVEFFQAALDNAYRVLDEINEGTYVTNKEQIKAHTPVVFASTLSKIDKDAEVFVERKLMNSDRARRKFIMIDADFDPGQEKESEEVRQRLIYLADDHKTPILIYPTVSYPDKPRFRAVLFCKRGLNHDSYFQAVTWLYEQIKIDPLDASDFRISANRNAPIFMTNEQAEHVYSTLDDESLQPLDNKLWAKYQKPKKRKPVISREEQETLAKELGITYDENKLVSLTRTRVAQSKIGESRNDCWRFIESVASAVAMKTISYETGVRMMEGLAERADDEFTRKKWAEGNIKQLDSDIESLSCSGGRNEYTLELFMWRHLAPAAK